mmetsp:Transcript_33248/g.40803  ORF Transcript_33248/g.40803 Transcript_33248/m.40803 type:complete len:204 (-) Transcript_33248:259-870(-)
MAMVMMSSRMTKKKKKKTAMQVLAKARMEQQPKKGERLDGKKEREAAKIEEKEKRPHRMNRKKRRRMELRKLEELDRKRLKEEQGDNQKLVPMETRQKVSAKRSKKAEQEKGIKEIGKTIKERDREKADKRSKKQKTQTKKLPGFDYDISVGRKESLLDKRMKSKKEPNEFQKIDTLKTGGLRKGGKLGRNKFKSRQKYKRRK